MYITLVYCLAKFVIIIIVIRVALLLLVLVHIGTNIATIHVAVHRLVGSSDSTGSILSFVSLSLQSTNLTQIVSKPFSNFLTILLNI